MKSKSQHTIKTRSLNATLPTIVCYIYVTAGAEPLGRGGCTRTLQSVQERYYVREHYESSTADVTTPGSLTQLSSTLPSFAMRAPPPPTAHDGSTYPSYMSANSSILQATAARGAHRRVVVNDTQSVINDMTNLSEGLSVIDDTSTMTT